MSTRNSSRLTRGFAVAVSAAVLLSAGAPQTTTAAPLAPPSKQAAAIAPAGDDAGILVVRIRHHHHYYGGGPGFAFMGMVIGTIGAIAAEQRRQEYYDAYYGGYPYAYYGTPYYYGAPYGVPAYGVPRYYGVPHYHYGYRAFVGPHAYPHWHR